jgi:hypothetical protein
MAAILYGLDPCATFLVTHSTAAIFALEFGVAAFDR